MQPDTCLNQITNEKSNFTNQFSHGTDIINSNIFPCKKEFTAKTSANPLITPTDSNFVSLAVATMAATQASNSQMVSAVIAKKSVQSFTGFSNAKQILDSLAVPDRANPSYYIFNYVGGGFVIVPADKRVEPILSYADKGYFPKSGKIPGGLVNWLSVNHKNMQLLRKNTTIKVSPRVAKLWAQLAIKPNIGAGKTTNQLSNLPPDNNPPSCEETSSYTFVGPLLQTAWAQGYPYNQLCPTGTYYYGNGHRPTGCVATATAQVMYYWKMPASYNWSIMPLTSSWSTSYAGVMQVSQLMRDVGNNLWMIYDDNGSYPCRFLAKVLLLY